MRALAALLLAAGAAFGQSAEEWGRRLRALAEESPEAVFVERGPFPDAYERELEKAGWPKQPLSNRTAWLLFERTQRAPMKGPEGLAAMDFDGTEPPEKPGKRKHGLNILGIELGGGVDQVKNDVEPYLPKTAPGPLDWD